MKLATLLASAFVATAVQASEVTVNYCVQGGDCEDVSLKPFECNPLPYPGVLSSFQNTAACVLFSNPDCAGRYEKYLPRGSYDSGALKGIFVFSFQCAEPGLQRNRAPAVQAAEVTINYCLKGGLCTDAYVDPYECTVLENPGPLDSLQSTAKCQLYTFSNCGGRSIVVERGSTLLHGAYAKAIKCDEPSFLRNQRPMRML
ncbi:hypothetical protein BGZ68_006139 [Mortierella alpina]|nr:hypothetical protein BGZ68_006139 [Mortierella alpina]